jgi:uncharacterized protein YjbI with pentapeptide repeats
LQEVDENGTDLHGANLREACLQDAHLERANLSRTNLRGACLRAAHLGGADLTGTDLRAADLRGAVLSDPETGSRGMPAGDADLHRARLRGARYDRFTRWPAGFDPGARGARLED